MPCIPVTRPTKHAPDRGDARTRLLDKGHDMFRARGFAATTVDALCADAQVTKGAYFHHFASKEAAGIATARHWADTTAAFFATAPCHAATDPLDRVLASVAFRRAMLEPDLQAAITARAKTHLDAASLARHTQTVLQGAFVMSKAAQDAGLAREALEHLDRYLRLLFDAARLSEAS